MNVFDSVFPYIGGKWRIAKDIIKLIPAHDIYVEPFFGSGAIFFKKPPSKIEVINDKNSDIVNFFDVLRDPELRERLIQDLRLTPYSREMYHRCRKVDPEDDRYTRAYKLFVTARMGHGGFKPNASAYKRGLIAVNGFRTSKGIRGTHAKEVKQFRGAIERLESYSGRLLNAYIENQNYEKVIQQWDEPETFFYLDPPYDGLKYYRHNFVDLDHEQLKDILVSIHGKFILSYYETELIGKLYPEDQFNIIRKVVSVNTQTCQKGLAKNQREELLIMNFQPENDIPLFAGTGV